MICYVRLMSYLRRRLAKRLEQEFPGCTVDADDLIPATGSWRTNIQLDVWRWEGVMVDDNGVRRVIGSYYTMTDLVKCKSLTFDGCGTGEILGT